MSKRIVESLYRISGVKLNEMALEEMPMIDTSGGRNSYRSHLKGAKDMLVKIKHMTNEASNDTIKEIYNMIKRELLFDIENHAKSWKADGVNTDSLCSIYDKCIQEFGNLYENRLSNTSFWDKKYYELYDLLQELELNSGLGIIYSREMANK